MEYEKQQTVPHSNLYPTAPSGDPHPPPYALQSPPPGGVAYPQGPPQQPAYHQPYPSAIPNQPYGQAGYHTADHSGGPPAYGYPAPGSVGYGGQAQPMVVMSGQPQPMVVMAGHQQTYVVAQPSSVSMIGAIVLSCFVFWCCGLFCGLIGFILAMVGQSKSSSGQTQSAIQLRNVSYGISVVGIVVGIIFLVLVIVLQNR